VWAGVAVARQPVLSAMERASEVACRGLDCAP
jgi:hypothetical protein